MSLLRGAADPMPPNRCCHHGRDLAPGQKCWGCKLTAENEALRAENAKLRAERLTPDEAQAAWDALNFGLLARVALEERHRPAVRRLLVHVRAARDAEGAEMTYDPRLHSPAGFKEYDGMLPAGRPVPSAPLTDGYRLESTGYHDGLGGDYIRLIGPSGPLMCAPRSWGIEPLRHFAWGHAAASEEH